MTGFDGTLANPGLLEFNHASQNTGTSTGWQRQTGGAFTITVPGYYVIHQTEVFGAGSTGTVAFRAIGVGIDLNPPTADMHLNLLLPSNAASTITTTYMRFCVEGEQMTPWRYTNVANHYSGGVGYLRAVRVA